jgi:YHS domain-containing protein
MNCRLSFALGIAALSMATAVSAAGPTLDEAKCPVSGKPVVEESGTPYKGGILYFCCENCPEAFKGNPSKYAVKANQQLVVTGQAVEVKCPLTGRNLNPATAVDVGGAKVAFCCKNCKAKFESAGPVAQANLVFNDDAFDKGFKVGK